jgi:predicted peptidase
MTNVTAITEVFGDGQKLTAVALEYGKEIDNSKLAKSAFLVAGRTVTKAYANSEAGKAPQGKDGRFVVLELSPTDEGAALFVQQGRTCSVSQAHVVATQVDEITTVDGEKIAPDHRPVSNSRVVNLVVDDFRQFEYRDPATGIVLKYNLFVPKGYDESKSYPLVTFIHDLGVTGAETTMTLVQGLGAVIWASPSEQAKHECFVLAPQYSTQIVNDNSDDSEYLDATLDLIKSIGAQYNIDVNRLYATGQSGGCMTFIAANIKYPDLLAASLLVAGQWDPAKVSPMAKANLWIVVSEGDLKAFPGMNAITKTLEREGAGISRATWSGRASADEFASGVGSMLAEGNHIMYTVLRKGTVVPPDMRDDGGSNHVCTWRIAYQIEGIRDWLFSQVKSTGGRQAAEKRRYAVRTRSPRARQGRRKRE